MKVRLWARINNSIASTLCPNFWSDLSAGLPGNSTWSYINDKATSSCSFLGNEDTQHSIRNNWFNSLSIYSAQQRSPLWCWSKTQENHCLLYGHCFKPDTESHFIQDFEIHQVQWNLTLLRFNSNILEWSTRPLPLPVLFFHFLLSHLPLYTSSHAQKAHVQWKC